MKRSVLFCLIFTAGVFVIGFSGCAKEKEVDLTDWSMPKFDKEVVETKEAVKPEEEPEQPVMEPRPITYVVKRGDSISAIAIRHGMSPQRLSEANNLSLKGSKSIIYPGQTLIIPDIDKSIYHYEK